MLKEQAILDFAKQTLEDGVIEESQSMYVSQSFLPQSRMERIGSV